MKARGTRDYARTLAVAAPATRVFDAIATLAGVRGWWTPLVSGSVEPGGRFRLEFEGLDEHIDVRVAVAARPSVVEWSIVEHSSLDEWSGTKIRFVLKALSAQRSALHFLHQGLAPALECYEDCALGWQHFLASLVAFAERGTGAPFRAAEAQGRRAR